jgi:hypothetical protein
VDGVELKVPVVVLGSRNGVVVRDNLPLRLLLGDWWADRAVFGPPPSRDRWAGVAILGPPPSRDRWLLLEVKATA